MLNPSLVQDSSKIEDRKVLTFQVIKVIAGILLVFFIPLEYLISNSLNDLEKHALIRIQDDRTDTGINFFKILDYFGNHVFLIVIFPALYHFYDARKAMKIIIVVCISMYMHSFLALLYMEPRPFWYSSSIKGEICTSGFGLPSLEILLVTVLFIYTAAELFRNRGPIESTIAYSLCVALISLYVTAALYLGEHFPHQCVVTICFAFIYLTGAFSLDKYISNMALKTCFGYNENRKNSIYMLLAVLALFCSIIAMNNLITNIKGISIYWIKHALKHCDNDYQVNGSDSFYISAWIFYMQGAVFGCMFTAKRLSMFWWMTPYYKRFIRSVIACGISYGVFTLFGLFDFSADASTFSINYVLPLLIMGFVTHGIMPLVFAKVHLALSITPDVDDETELTSYYGNI